ncbi:MAG: DUF2804 domain-containing protein [Eubacteriales bacterium]|nr:DUF2804 domain-containing protein [Eubacteriales bacterium]
MQHILNQGDLLDQNGRLHQAGYSTELVKKYDRTAIKAGKSRIKEWDYYLIYNDDFGVALTVDDNSYMGMISASFLDFRTPCERTKSTMFWFPMGKLNFPPSSKYGAVEKSLNGCMGSFTHEDDKRHLVLYMENFEDKTPFYCELWLEDEPRDSMVIATPFANKATAFYYNQKIIAMRASGHAEYRGKTYEFDKDNSFGLLDWGRGVWTYSNTWYWGAAQGEQDGHRIGFNIGYGFGDTSAASENMFFLDGIAHKLEGVDFGIPQKNGRDDYMSPWNMTSTDGRFTMTFTPILDRHSDTNALFICSKQHQVFGSFNGTVMLDDGTVLTVDNLRGFAEKVKNRW